MRAKQTPRNKGTPASRSVVTSTRKESENSKLAINLSERKSKGKNTKPPAREGAHPLLSTKTEGRFVCVPRPTKMPINKMPWV